MFGQNCGTLYQRLVCLYVFITDGGAAQAHLEGDTTFDLLVHASDLGLAEGSLVLGRHLGAYG